MKYSIYGACLLSFPFSVSAHENHSAASSEIVESAQVLVNRIEGMKPADAGRLIFDFDAPKRETIDFFPLNYHRDTGAVLANMDEAGKAASLNLLEAVLSEQGYACVMGLFDLEDALLSYAKDPSTSNRLRDNYSIQLFGEPSNSEAWAMKFEGHHLSINMTMKGEGLRGSPLFLGSNPAEVLDGPKKGLRVLAAQEDLAWALFDSLEEAQKATAMQQDAQLHIRRGGPLAQVVEYPGLQASDLDVGQQKTLFSLIHSYVGTVHPAIAKAEMAEIRARGLDKLVFTWMGGKKRGQQHAYRIQGPTVLIEYETRGKNHVHCQWRNPERDFGKDLMAEHLKEAHTSE